MEKVKVSLFKCTYDSQKLGLELKVLQNRLSVVRVPDGLSQGHPSCNVQPGDFVYALNGVRCYSSRLPALEVLNQIRVLPRPLFITFGRPTALDNVAHQPDVKGGQLQDVANEGSAPVNIQTSPLKASGQAHRKHEWQRAPNSEEDNVQRTTLPWQRISHDNNKEVLPLPTVPQSTATRPPTPPNMVSENDTHSLQNEQTPITNTKFNDEQDEPSCDGSDSNEVDMEAINSKVDQILEAHKAEIPEEAWPEARDYVTKAVIPKPESKKKKNERAESPERTLPFSPILQKEKQEDFAYTDDLLATKPAMLGSISPPVDNMSASGTSSLGRMSRRMSPQSTVKKLASRSISPEWNGATLSPNMDLSRRSLSPSGILKGDNYSVDRSMNITRSVSNPACSTITADTFKKRCLSDKVKGKVAKLQAHKSDLVGTVDHDYFARSYKIKAFVRSSIYAVMVDPENNGQSLFNEIHRLEKVRKGTGAAKFVGLFNETSGEYIMAQAQLRTCVLPGNTVRALLAEEDTEGQSEHLGYIAADEVSSVTSTARGRARTTAANLQNRSKSMSSFSRNAMGQLQKLVSRQNSVGRSTKNGFSDVKKILEFDSVSVTSQITEQVSEELYAGLLTTEEQEAIIKEELDKAQAFLHHNVMIEAKRNLWNQQLIEDDLQKREQYNQNEKKSAEIGEAIRQRKAAERSQYFSQRSLQTENTLKAAKSIFKEQHEYALEKNKQFEKRRQQGLKAKAQMESQYKESLKLQDMRRNMVQLEMKEMVQKEIALQEIMIHSPGEVFMALKDDEDPLVANLAKRALLKKRAEERIKLRAEARQVILKARLEQQKGTEYSNLSDWRQKTTSKLSSPGPGAYNCP